ncbi:MGDG synthase family glycosyltransferase [Radiobacillus deserti]|uniref:Galactosyldiacylglycerol synthase n=1 Tax=Radiobacillus deserti TaxID=2594883 RepID=A0A516KEY6_9BACI|nr:glycosyltransferase [Radiobacillus deserti]QDP39964.1 galactosyldiacylglycerol synthase [Radiobacillus deserti]
MKKILFFPLLDSLPSGHHQVANAVTEYMNKRSDVIVCKKIDVMSSWNSVIESLVTKTYLGWIQKNPKSYAWVYRKLAYKSKAERSYKHYELLFLKEMEKIIAEEKPDLIICTHAFPSYLVSKLKKSGACSIPLVNVYTDFFINDVWGRECVDYHFVPDISLKFHLIKKYGIGGKNILVTGIPIDESFYSTSLMKKADRELTILLSGGSAGLGKIREIIDNFNRVKGVQLYVLCGNNKQLYKEIFRRNEGNIHPLPYINSRRKMNELYDVADAIITKPGGVTISEAIKKKVPIFVHSALPGQEIINLKQLKEQGLVFTIEEGLDVAKQIKNVLRNEAKMEENQQSLERFSNAQDFREPEEIFHFINSVLDPSYVKVQQTM